MFQVQSTLCYASLSRTTTNSMDYPNFDTIFYEHQRIDYENKIKQRLAITDSEDKMGQEDDEYDGMFTFIVVVILPL